MKKTALVIACLLLGARFFAQGYNSGLYMEGGFGLNLDQNVGLGFVNTSKGPYFGIGAGAAFDWDYQFKISLGVNIDFLVNPEITFVRGEEHYDVQNTANTASLRIMPYLEISRAIIDWFYAGFGVGYGFNNIYFGVRPQIYDREYSSYQLSSNSITPLLFVRAYVLGSCFVSLNYECDIVINGKIDRVAGDPLANFTNIDGATNINGVHHRGRLVIGYVLGF